MELTHTTENGVLLVQVDGRIDGYWSDHLDTALDQAVREGHHRIAVDCTRVSFLSSAGIGILVKHHKELARIGGSFSLVNASKPVATVLRITRLSDLLLGGGSVPTAPASVPVARTLQTDSLALEVFDLDAAATMTCRALGSPQPLVRGTFDDVHSVSLANSTARIVVGVGAFGDSFAECQGRFGELLSVDGATAYQPADGTNVPDYLVMSGGPGSDVRLLYGLAAEGSFSHLVRFEPGTRGTTVPLTSLVDACLGAAGCEAAALVLVAETEGLVGAALRRSPTQHIDEGDFFSHPAVRTRVSFTPTRLFAHGVSLTAGFVVRGSTADVGDGQLRPIGASHSGHLHAASFRFQPIQRGPIDLQDTLARLFEPGQLQGVVHLLTDDRGAAGAGDSAFIRGACWLAPLA
jgi:anti-anti-sigma factor